MTPVKLITATQAATLAKISRQRFNQLLHSTNGPKVFQRVGSNDVFDEDEIMGWILLRNKEKARTEALVKEIQAIEDEQDAIEAEALANRRRERQAAKDAAKVKQQRNIALARTVVTDTTPSNKQLAIYTAVKTL